MCWHFGYQGLRDENKLKLTNREEGTVNRMNVLSAAMTLSMKWRPTVAISSAVSVKPSTCQVIIFLFLVTIIK
jgi:hypothetical protein